MKERFSIAYNHAYPRDPRDPRGSRLFCFNSRLGLNKSSALMAIRRGAGPGRIGKIDIAPRAIQNARETERIPAQNRTNI